MYRLIRELCTDGEKEKAGKPNMPKEKPERKTGESGEGIFLTLLIRTPSQKPQGHPGNPWQTPVSLAPPSQGGWRCACCDPKSCSEGQEGFCRPWPPAPVPGFLGASKASKERDTSHVTT